MPFPGRQIIINIFQKSTKPNVPVVHSKFLEQERPNRTPRGQHGERLCRTRNMVIPRV